MIFSTYRVSGFALNGTTKSDTEITTTTQLKSSTPYVVDISIRTMWSETSQLPREPLRKSSQDILFNARIFSLRFSIAKLSNSASPSC